MWKQLFRALDTYEECMFITNSNLVTQATVLQFFSLWIATHNDCILHAQQSNEMLFSFKLHRKPQYSQV